MEDNYVIYHLHSDLSNCVTNIDSITKYYQYVDWAKDQGMKALAFSEHGSCMEWYHKKCAIEDAGMLYIHSCEFYVTEKIEEKIKDNWHCVLMARNEAGFREINRLVTKSFNRQSGNFYYVPRITVDDLFATSDNVIITTACLGGILNKADEGIQARFLEFMSRNHNRCFLEIQHHDVEEQRQYNAKLVKLSSLYRISLIAGTDTHALNNEHLIGRKKLQEGKGIHFANEDSWDLVAHTYDELCALYSHSSGLESKVWMGAIQNTNLLLDLVEPFKIGRDYKYPKLYPNGNAELKKKINEGFLSRGIDKLPNKKDYIDRIHYEMQAIEHNHAEDFFLLEEDYKREMRSRGIGYGPSRGSVSGSIVCYLLYITDVDSLKYNLNFDRFLNIERISLADVDTDWSPDERNEVEEFLFHKDGLYCADIVTFNTIKLKGAFTDIARAYSVPIEEVHSVTSNIESNEEKYRKKYAEIFKYVDLVNGTIVSMGNHPCAILVSPIPLDDYIGLVSTSTDKYPILQLNMKEVDSQNFVKLDALRLENVGIINKTCDMVHIPRLTPDNCDFYDKNVWKSIKEDTVGIFQWESGSASQYLKKLFSDETISKIEKKNGSVDMLALMSVGNGAIRPAGESYRDQLANGEFHDNGHIGLNKMLEKSNGFLVYQEQIIQFLHEFCGFTMGEADGVRRAFSKKLGTDKYIPKIIDGFIKTMKDKYNVDKEESKKIVVDFIKVIEDASNYLFSENHALPYSMIGYMCGWLRYYHTIEFCSVYLNTYYDNEEKLNKMLTFMGRHGILLEPPKFRHSKGDYLPDNANKKIYKGMRSIKYINEECIDSLYDMRNIDFPTFTDFLVYIAENTKINARQLKVLTAIDFLSEFGKTGKLMGVLEKFLERYSKTHKEKTKIQRIEEIKKYENHFENMELPIKDRISFEKDYLGYVALRLDWHKRYVYVLSVDVKYTPKAKLYCLSTGKIIECKVDKSEFNKNPIKPDSIIYCEKFTKRENWLKTEDGFKKNGTFSDVLIKWRSDKHG